MGLNIKEVPKGQGSYFSPKDVADAEAILFEVKDFRRDVEGGNYGPKDTAYADVTVFKTRESLKAGEPTTIIKRSSIQQTLLARDLGEEIGPGNATVATVVHTNFKASSGWVLRQCNADAVALVVAYVDKRDAEVEAFLADAPDFS